MARFGVTKQAVFEAANSLYSQGLSPTLKTIRDELGSGSNTTILPFLNEWKKIYSSDQEKLLGGDLPAEFVSVMRSLWEKLQAEATDKIASNSSDYQEKLETLMTDLQELRAKDQKWQQMHDHWAKEKDRLVLRAADQQKEIDALTNQAKTNAANFEIIINERQTLVDELKRILKTEQLSRQHFEEQIAKQRIEQESKYQQQLTQLRSELKNAELQLVNVQHTNVTLKQTVNEKDLEIENLQKKYEQINQQHFETKNFICFVQNENAEMKNILNQTNINLKDAQQEKLEINNKNLVIEEQLHQAKHEISKLNNQLDLLQQEKLLLIEERAKVEGMNKQLQQLSKSKIIAE